MYKELIESLRETSMDFGELDHVSVLLLEAADAIETLTLYADFYKDTAETLLNHYCPHAVRNVHDRGDDSLCRVMNTEIPKDTGLILKSLKEAGAEVIRVEPGEGGIYINGEKVSLKEALEAFFSDKNRGEDNGEVES